MSRVCGTGRRNGTCRRFLKFLEDHDLLDILAEHADLPKAPPGALFPYRIPPVPEARKRSSGWDPGAALDTDGFTGQARILLWFAIARDPGVFGQQWLFHQRLMSLFPPDGGKSGLHPVNRVARCVSQAAQAVLRAVELKAAAEAASDSGWRSSKRPAKRGRKPTYSPNKDEELARHWQAAKRQGAYKADFARDRGYSLKEFDRLLARVRARKRRAN
jgi:hypothetical protein